MPVGYRENSHRHQLIRQGLFLFLFYSCIEEVEADMTYLNRIIESPTPQSEPLPGMVPNSAGGHAYPVDDFTRLRRFLVLGSEGGSYYASERKLTLENALAVRRCIETDGPAAVREIVAVSEERRAPRVGPALFALAIAASHGDGETRALAFQSLPQVARTGSHLHEFAGYADSMRGWGRGLRRAIAGWYAARPVADVVYQAVKYRNRYGWTHRDLLRKVHARAEGPLNELFAWVTQGALPSDDSDLRLVHAFEQAKTADADTLADLIREHRMSWEMVPAEMMDRREVWQALSEDMPVNAYVRNLATMTRLGVISPMDSARACEVLGRIGTERGRVHPIGVLSGPADLSERQGHPGPARLGAGVAGGGRPGRRLRAVLHPGTADRLPAVPWHRRLRLHGPRRGGRRAGTDATDGRGSHGHGGGAAGAQPLPGGLRQQERHVHQVPAGCWTWWGSTRLHRSSSPTSPPRHRSGKPLSLTRQRTQGDGKFKGGMNQPCRNRAKNNSFRPCPTRMRWCEGTLRRCWASPADPRCCRSSWRH